MQPSKYLLLAGLAFAMPACFKVDKSDDDSSAGAAGDTSGGTSGSSGKGGTGGKGGTSGTSGTSGSTSGSSGTSGSSSGSSGSSGTAGASDTGGTGGTTGGTGGTSGGKAGTGGTATAGTSGTGTTDLCDGTNLDLSITCPSGTTSEFDVPNCLRYFQCTFGGICSASGLDCASCQSAIVSSLTTDDVCVASTTGLSDACDQARQAVATSYPQCAD